MRQSIAALSLSCALVLTSLFIAHEAYARCECRCVDGKVAALCENSVDLPPICAPSICPIVPPRIEPIQPPRIPPIGTTKCEQKQVYNPNTKRYEWQEICR